MFGRGIVADLIGKINPESTFVVMEATGGYEELLVTTLHEHNIALAVVNPRRVRDFAKGIGKDAKTDPIDAGVLAFYGEVVKPSPQLAKSNDEKKLKALVERRRQLLGLVNQEYNPLNTRAMPKKIPGVWGLAPMKSRRAPKPRKGNSKMLFESAIDKT